VQQDIPEDDSDDREKKESPSTQLQPDTLVDSEQSEPTSVSIVIKGVEYSTELERLSLDHMELTNSDIEPIKYMTNLTTLDLTGNMISDIGILANLSEVSSLKLSDNQISDISALANLTKLQYLHLSYNRISDVSCLAGLNELRFLRLDNNQIRDISDLFQLHSLVNLQLNNNQISDVSKNLRCGNAAPNLFGTTRIFQKACWKHISILIWTQPVVNSAISTVL